jgi:hypothetical protein
VNADDFNARYPVGTPVLAYPGTRPEDHPDATCLVTRTRSKATVLGGHTDVVWVDGHSACIALSHIDIAPRTNTPDRVEINDEGRKVTTITLKRACNGCGQYLGDADGRDVDEHGNLTDVRGECRNCRPLVALEAEGCKTWQLTPHNINQVDDAIDEDGIYAKGYFEAVDGKTACVGLRIGTGDTRLVARYGDWIIRHPDGRWAVHATFGADEFQAATS